MIRNSLFATLKRIDQISLSWNQEEGTFELQHDINSNFSTATTIYEGQAFNYIYTCTIGTHYFRVRLNSGDWFSTSIAVAYEPETTAFINKIIADNGSDVTNKPGAIDNFIKGLKRIDAWRKMKAIYLRYGSTFATQKLNLVNVNLFEIQNVNTPTRSLASTDYNGISNAENTGLIPQERLTADDVYLSIYSFDNVASNSFDIASRSGTFRMGIQLYAGSTGMSCYLTGDGSIFASLTIHRTDGRFVAKRKGTNITMMQGNGVQRKGIITGNVTLPTQPLYFGAINNLGSPTGYSTKKQGVAMIGEYLSDKQDIEIQSLVEQYYVDVGLVSTSSFMEGDSFSDSGILRDDLVLN